jgi:hypothetical protein
VPRALESLLRPLTGRWLLALALAGCTLGCRDEAAPPIRIVLGPAAQDEVTLVPKAALAELIEISPTESELQLTFSSVERGCDTPVTSSPDSVSLAVRLRLPGGAKLDPGRYPVADPTPTTEANPVADKPHALASVRLHGHRSELRPGGDLELHQVDATPQGTVDGLLKLDYAGDAEHAATRVSGRFSAHFCRINRLR